MAWSFGACAVAVDYLGGNPYGANPYQQQAMAYQPYGYQRNENGVVEDNARPQQQLLIRRPCKTIGRY